MEKKRNCNGKSTVDDTNKCQSFLRNANSVKYSKINIVENIIKWFASRCKNVSGREERLKVCQRGKVSLQCIDFKYSKLRI